MTLLRLTNRVRLGPILAAGLLTCSSVASGQQAGKTAAPPSGELTIAAAADLQFAMDDLLGGFRKLHRDIAVTVSYGSSGNFYTQLVNQAPFDMFLSADLEYPRKLAQQGLVVEGSEFTYAVGRLVIWTPSSSSAGVERRGMEALRSPAVQHVAIANPKHAPYGRAAESAMRALGVYDVLQPKLVYAENVAQALQFVQSGAADAGVVALSLALSPTVSGQGVYWEVPLKSYPRMEQGGCILKRVRDRRAAEAFRSYMQGTQARALLKRYGFYLPGE